MKNINALLFINGEPPKTLPDTANISIIACTDGAFHYLRQKKFPVGKLDFISGDFDSHAGFEEDFPAEKFIATPDQDKTDFEKALEILIEKGVSEVCVYGGSGGEMDHFLGNLTVALRFKNRLKIKFYDEFSEYFFAPKYLVLENVSGKMISLYPFPNAENVTTDGLNWELSAESLSQTERIGTRNFAVKNTVSVDFEDGELLIFAGKKYR